MLVHGELVHGLISYIMVVSSFSRRGQLVLMSMVMVPRYQRSLSMATPYIERLHAVGVEKTRDLYRVDLPSWGFEHSYAKQVLTVPNVLWCCIQDYDMIRGQDVKMSLLWMMKGDDRMTGPCLCVQIEDMTAKMIAKHFYAKAMGRGKRAEAQ
jgi:hypothetical protein